VRRVLRALTVRKLRRRRALLKKAFKALPTSKRCPSPGFIPDLPAYRLIGRIPTAAYPDSVQTTPQGQLLWVAGKGFGSGPNPTYYFGGAKTPLQTPANAYGTYVLDLLIGRVGTLPLPTDHQVVTDTVAANAQAKPDNSEPQPAGSPIPAVTGQPSTQIKHVFYIVRENRTYDQIFGSEAGAMASCTQDSGLYNGTGTPFAGQSRFNDWYPEFQQQVATGTVPALNYMILPDDHTNGTTPGDPTPQAFIADNDLALGQMVDAISHSSIWPSTAIFVVEDDSQDGADHVDSHRSPALVISPWARQGAVIHTRYDQYSVLRTLELILGLQPLALNDALATPMYDAFISGSQQPNDTPYTVRSPTYLLTSTNSATAANARLSRELIWNRLDAVPQAISDEILWASVHGTAMPAPHAGPDASPVEANRAAVVREMLRRYPSVFQLSSRPASANSRRCPITWACRPSPPGEG
jgi:hypothetical protein